jgi:hypothetical protein
MQFNRHGFQNRPNVNKQNGFLHLDSGYQSINQSILASWPRMGLCLWPNVNKQNGIQHPDGAWLWINVSKTECNPLPRRWLWPNDRFITCWVPGCNSADFAKSDGTKTSFLLSLIDIDRLNFMRRPVIGDVFSMKTNNTGKFWHKTRSIKLCSIDWFFGPDPIKGSHYHEKGQKVCCDLLFDLSLTFFTFSWLFE